MNNENLVAEKKVIVPPNVPVLKPCEFCETTTYRTQKSIAVCANCEFVFQRRYKLEQEKMTEVITE